MKKESNPSSKHFRVFHPKGKNISTVFKMLYWDFVSLKLTVHGRQNSFATIVFKKRNLIEFTIENLELAYKLEKRPGRQNNLPPN